MFEERGDDMARMATMPEPSSEHPIDEALVDQISFDSCSSSPSPSSSLMKELNPHKSSPSAAERPVDQIASLLQFASTGKVADVQQILDGGLDVNSKDYDGRTALHLAASEGHYGVVKLLLDRKANVNPVDRREDTPLVNAMRYVKGDLKKRAEYQRVYELLLTSGGRGTINQDPGNKQAEKDEELEQQEQLDQLQEEYEIERDELDIKNGKVIGTGSYGEVYLVNWRGTKVAAKMILQRLEQREEIKKEFRMELLLLQSLRHPNIVEFLGAVTKSNPLVIVTEYLANGDLHEIIQRKGRIPAKTAVAYALDIARGMNYLHQNKPKAIVHRDLKPRNLLQDEAGHLKVADFGLSKLLEPRPRRGNDGLYHMTGGTGTYRYMAPEVYLHHKYDKSVDVFSFAIIVNEMFEGRPAQQTDPGDEVANARARSERRPTFFAKTYPPEMKTLLKQCWDGNPTKRPTFEDIIRQLEDMETKLKQSRGWKAKPISEAVSNISYKLSRLVSHRDASRRGDGCTLPNYEESVSSSLFTASQEDDSSISGRNRSPPQQEQQQPPAAITAKQNLGGAASTSSSQN